MGASHRDEISTIVFWVSACVIIGIWANGVQGWAQAPDREVQLRARLQGYWEAMEQADFEAASQFVEPQGRTIFRDTPKGRMGRWKIDKLEFNEDKTVCEVTTIVRKAAPMFGAELDWPMLNQWVLADGVWYFRMPWKEKQNPFLEVFKAQQQTVVTQPEDPASDVRRDPAKIAADLNVLTPDPKNPTVVHFGQKATFRYIYTNNGAQPVRITSVEADCHCTSVRKDYPEVAPGQSENIEVTLDTFGLPLGPLEKTVHVGLSDRATPLQIALAVTNEPNFQVAPLQVDFGEVPAGGSAENTARVTNKSGKTVNILSSMNSDPRLKVSLSATTLKPSEDVALTLSYQAGASGEFMDNIFIRTDLAEEPILNIRIRGKVTP
jgi:hypothetical protein